MLVDDDYDDSEQILDYYYEDQKDEQQEERCMHYWDQLNSDEQGDTKQRDEMRPSFHDREEPQEGLEPAAKSPRLSSSPIRRRLTRDNNQLQGVPESLSSPSRPMRPRNAFQRSHGPRRSIGGTIYYNSSAGAGTSNKTSGTSSTTNNFPGAGNTPLSPKQSAFGRAIPFPSILPGTSASSASPRGTMNTTSSSRVSNGGLTRSTTLPSGLSSAASPAGLVNPSPRLSHASLASHTSPRSPHASLAQVASSPRTTHAGLASPRASRASLASPRAAHASLATPTSSSRHNSASYQSPTATHASLYTPRAQAAEMASSPLEYAPRPAPVGLSRSQTIQSFSSLGSSSLAPAEPVALSRRNSYTPQGNRLWDEMTVLKERIRKLKLPSDASASSSQSQNSDTSSTSQTSIHSSPPKESPRRGQQRFTRPRANTQEPRVRESWQDAAAPSHNRISWQEPVPASVPFSVSVPQPPPTPQSYSGRTAAHSYSGGTVAERHLVEVFERAKRTGSLSAQRLPHIMLDRVVSDTIALYHTATDEGQVEAIDKTCLSLADFIAHYDAEDTHPQREPSQQQFDDSPAPLSASALGPPPPRRFTTARARPVSMYSSRVGYSSPLTRSANEDTIDDSQHFSSPLRYTPSRRF
ncbi:hypothetical protein TRVA0_045S00650 [Trichomonascus vanleenenianus]|uniref:uncharacterized protein n=1 Tax=Trichomonascus vanleenenianus TaxID=2268995 RepID=UPI003ECA6962